MRKRKELWLEYGFKKDKWEDVCWYNEGRASDFFYFMKEFIKDFFKKNMYYKIRYGKLTIYLKGRK